MLGESCGNSAAICHKQLTDESSMVAPSHCAAAEVCSERLSPEDTLSKTEKCSGLDTVAQKTSKELAKVKKREDKGIGKLYSLCVNYVLIACGPRE